jgi:hypothetical protein
MVIAVEAIHHPGAHRLAPPCKSADRDAVAPGADLHPSLADHHRDRIHRLQRTPTIRAALTRLGRAL